MIRGKRFRAAVWTLTLLLALWRALAPDAALAAQGQEMTLDSPDGPVTCWIFRAPGDAPRPAVIILPGRQGVAPGFRAYSSYASRLTQRGMDVCLVSYYAAGEAEAVNALDKPGRLRLYALRTEAWTARVRAVTETLLRRHGSNGRIGLVGFSQGGFLGVSCAASNDYLSALVVYYAGVPGLSARTVRRLPPLLAFHGKEDQVVPFSAGEELVAFARSLGGQAELVAYPGEGHGFEYAASRDAGERTANFLAARLR